MSDTLYTVWILFHNEVVTHITSETDLDHLGASHPLLEHIIKAEKKQLALQVAEYMKLTTKATVAHMKEFSGAFVTYVPGLELMKDQPSPILDNQFVYPMYLKAAVDEKITPWYRTSAFFVDASRAINGAMFKILTENAPVEASLKEAANSIRDLQKQKGEM